MKKNLPYCARWWLSKKRKSIYYPVFIFADLLNLWKYPADYNPDQWHRIINDIYWNYKSGRPILNPEKGSALQDYFVEKRELTNQSLLPNGFRRKASLRISAVGDLIRSKFMAASAGKFYQKVAEHIFNADISFGNLESPLNSPKIIKGNATIHSTRAQFDALKGHYEQQYTIFNTANNHILDHGVRGLDYIHERLESEGFLYVGTNQTCSRSRKALIITVNSIKVGIVAATYSVNNQPFPDGKEYLVNLVPFHRFKGTVNLSLLKEQISFCRANGCDFVLVSLHWGFEFEFFPRQDQVDIAHQLVEYGADAIISHHAHNIQSYEFYQTTRDTTRIAPIFYGLGNLSSVWSAPYHTLSLVINLIVSKGHINGTPKTLVERVNVTPVVQTLIQDDIITFLQLERLTKLKKESGAIKRSDLEEAIQYADLVIGKSWRV